MPHDYGPREMEASAPTCDRETDAGVLQGGDSNCTDNQCSTQREYFVPRETFGVFELVRLGLFERLVSDDGIESLTAFRHANPREWPHVLSEIARQHGKASMRIVEDIVGQARPIGAPWPEPLDMLALHRTAPVPPGHIIDPLIPKDCVTLYSGHGGAGKSTVSGLQAVCTAVGQAFAGYATEKHIVLYVSCEDREAIMHWRLKHICDYLGVTIADLHGKLHVLDMVGHDAVLWRHDPKEGGKTTNAYAQLQDVIKATGASVIYLDGVADVYGGNENDRGQVKQFVNALTALIPAGGALVLIGHTNKATATAATSNEGYSGSTAWHNSARSRLVHYPETDSDDDHGAIRTGRMILEQQKANHAEAGARIVWTWDSSAHLFVPESAPMHVDRKHQADEERRGILLAMRSCAIGEIPVPAATTGRRTAFHVLAAQPAFADSMRSGKPAVRRFWREMEQLRAIKLITEGSIRRADRHLLRTYELTPEGMRVCEQ